MADPITREQLCPLVENGTAIVVDALPAAPYQHRHLPGAINLTLEDVDAKAAERLPYQGASIVTYSTSATCGRGEALAARLEALGYRNVRTYVDGIEDWVAAGLPIEVG
jgi:rhodanese-related sulfurtransferase